LIPRDGRFVCIERRTEAACHAAAHFVLSRALSRGITTENSEPDRDRSVNERLLAFVLRLRSALLQKVVHR